MANPGTALFVSDLHLSPHQAAIADHFLAFLSGPARHAASLTILGDLFDYWAGDDDLADPFNARIVAALRDLSERGVTVAFMAGNRDFLVGNDFAAAAGVERLPDPCLRDIAGVRTLLSHGDALCTDDVDYQRFRAQVRSPEWRTTFLARPLAERRREIETLRARSEAEKKRKSIQIMDVNDEAVAAALRSHGAQTLIHGHTHRQGSHVHVIDGQDCRRWVLGDWHPGHGTALVVDTDGWHFAS